MVLKVIEGCICYSYTIDGKEFCKLADNDSEIYDPELIENTINKLLESYLYEYSESKIDNVYNVLFDNDLYDIVINKIQEIIKDKKYLELFCVFETIVKHHPNTQIECSEPCQCCGDSIWSYTLILE